jgi:hypothetical protein
MVESGMRSQSFSNEHRKPYISERFLIPPLVASITGPLLQKLRMSIKYPMKNGELAATLNPTISGL